MPERPGDMDERDVDARFASIIAAWDGPLPGVDDPTEAAPQGEPTATGVEAGTAEPVDGTDGTDGTDAADASDSALPASAPRSPWVNPSPLNVVVPASAWRTPDALDPEVEAARRAALESDSTPEDEHYEPPEVVLPPQEDLHFWGAVIGLVAGPLMLLYVVFARPFHSTRWFVASVVVSLAGFALLIMRQPTHRDPTSGDDGARL